MFRLLFLLFLTSCSAVTNNIWGNGTFADADSFHGRFPDNKKSLILIKYADFSRDPLYWCEVRNVKQEIKNIDNCYKVEALDAYQIFMVEPGIYKLAQYRARKDDYIFGNPQKVFSSKASLVFKTESQKFTYVGAVRKKGARYAVSDDFDVIQRGFETKNYQELMELFSYSFDEVYNMVEAYEEVPEPMIKRLASVPVSEKKVKKRQKTSGKNCQAACSKNDLRILKMREEKIKIHQDRYSKKYLKELRDELHFDKMRCGVK